MRDWWNRLKCWVWKRHTTVKPRYLDHTWSDRRELIPHMMFEILCRFVEEECSPGHMEWYGELGPRLESNKPVLDEMKELIAWWHETFNKEYPEVSDILWKEAEKHMPVFSVDVCELGEPMSGFTWLQRFATDEDEVVYRRCMDALNKLEQNMFADLDSRLHRIVTLTPFMRT